MAGVLVVGRKKGLSSTPGEGPLLAHVVSDSEHHAPQKMSQ
jgi:hypothetical protein